MTDPIWYFAQGETEQGPVTSEQLKALFASGKLGSDDLVWKEGMPDWVVAREVPELAEPLQSVGPGGLANRSAPRRTSRWSMGRMLQRPFTLGPTLGRPLLLLGLVLVVLTRGCDRLGDRYVARLQAIASSAEEQFQIRWENQRAELEERRDKLREQSELTPDQRQQLDEIDEQLAALDQRMRSEMVERRRQRWRSQQAAARTAINSNEMWAYWRALFFLLSTVVFSIGLLLVGLTGERSERWMSLAILAVLVYSIYVDGAVWSG